MLTHIKYERSRSVGFVLDVMGPSANIKGYQVGISIKYWWGYVCWDFVLFGG